MGALRIGIEDKLGWRDALLALTLIAALIRSLVPMGFMPETRNGQFEIVICTIDGMQRVPAGETGGLADTMAGVHAPCAFGALATLAPPPSAPIVSLPMAVAAGQITLDEWPPRASAARLSLQAPRAPPALHA